MYEDLFKRIKLADFPIGTRAAYTFAKYKHKQMNLVRKGSGLPYFVHPKGVAYIVMENGGSLDQIKAAFLHDTIEDTETSTVELRGEFGDHVADLVWELTNSKYDIDKMGKDEYMSEKLKSLSDEALLIKLADMLYNITDRPAESAKTRMLKNTYDLIMARELPSKTKELAQLVFLG